MGTYTACVSTSGEEENHFCMSVALSQPFLWQFDEGYEFVESISRHSLGSASCTACFTLPHVSCIVSEAILQGSARPQGS